jgi:hypothetical protein
MNATERKVDARKGMGLDKGSFLTAAGLGALVLVAFLLMAAPGYAQTAAAKSNPGGPYSYDMSKEVKINATVEKVVTNPPEGTLAGTHLLLQTSAGRVDASLGMLALKGKDAIAIEPGQHVQVTGEMKTLKGGDVFFARTIQVNGHLYMLRNEHGVPMTHTGRGGSLKTVTEGGQL